MSVNEITEWEPRLTASLNRRGPIRTSSEFFEVLNELATPRDTLTADEQDFLIEHAGVTSADFAPEAARKAGLELLVARTTASAEAQNDALTTADVADLIGTAGANVRRLVGQRRLYTAGTTRTGSHVFPRWQFTPAGPLPHLGAIIAALPGDMHPADVAAFMTRPSDSLGERTPADWLASNGDPTPVVALVDALSWV